MTSDKNTLEQQLEAGILSLYTLPPGATIWRSHDKIGPDDAAHYFTRNSQNYVLVYNDFPEATFIHEEQLTPVLVTGGNDEWLHIPSGDLVGYYSLYLDS